MNKRGWVRILEATIAVLIVAGVMITVYSQQSVDEEVTLSEYSYTLQNQILDDIALNRGMRLEALQVDNDNAGDEHYVAVDNFVADRIPEGYGHLLRVCNLSDPFDHCNMDPIIFKATVDKDVYSEEEIVSSELGNGTDVVYAPKLVKLFFWKENPGEEKICKNECSEDMSYRVCKDGDLTKVYGRICGTDFDDDPCYEFGSATEVVLENCGEGYSCVGGECVENSPPNPVGWYSLVCEKSGSKWTYCGHTDWELYQPICAKDLGTLTKWGKCDCNAFGSACGEYYTCTIPSMTKNIGCSENPSCPSGYDLVSETPCCVSNWEPARSSVCSGVSFTQTDGCGNSRTKVGTDDTCVGRVTLAFTNVKYSFISGYHYYYHDRVLREKGGVGVTFTKGELCTLNAGCNSVSVNYRIEANDDLVFTNKKFYTSANSEKFTLTYTGKDDNGHSISVKEVMNVAGSSWN